MNTLLKEDLHRIISFMPKDVKKMLVDAPLFLAGGAIRSLISNEAVADWDIFGPDKKELELNAQRMSDKRHGRMFTTDNAFTVLSPGRVPVQFISRWLYDNPTDLRFSFDFSIARAVIWHAEGKWHSECDERFYPDLAAKRLNYMQPIRNEDAGGSMLRVQKFVRKGYAISPESLGRVMARLTSCVRFNEAMTADEPGQAKVLTGLLREVDPLSVIDGLEMQGTDDEDGTVELTT